MNEKSGTVRRRKYGEAGLPAVAPKAFGAELGKPGRSHFHAQLVFLPSFRRAANRSHDFIREIREIRGSILLAAALARLAQVRPVKVSWRFINSVEYTGVWIAIDCARKAAVENLRLFGRYRRSQSQ
jgi:hypothetical protein